MARMNEVKREKGKRASACRRLRLLLSRLSSLRLLLSLLSSLRLLLS